MSNPWTDDAPPFDMSITVAQNCAVEYGLTREDQDAWAVRSHQRAVKAIDAGSFVDEIVPIQVPQHDGSTVTFAEDEHPRRDTSLENAGRAKVLHPEIEGFTRHRGQLVGHQRRRRRGDWHSPPADTRQKPGQHPVLVAGRRAAAAHRQRPDLRHPEGTRAGGPQARGRRTVRDQRSVRRPGRRCARQLGLDEEIVNVYGSGISLGHPIAATGARMVTSAIYELRRRGGGIGVLSMCAGGGMGAAMVIEVA